MTVNEWIRRLCLASMRFVFHNFSRHMRVFCCGRRAVNSRFEQLVLLTGKRSKLPPTGMMLSLRAFGAVDLCDAVRACGSLESEVGSRLLPPLGAVPLALSFDPSRARHTVLRSTFGIPFACASSEVRLKLQRAVQHRFATSATGREGKASEARCQVNGWRPLDVSFGFVTSLLRTTLGSCGNQACCCC